MVQFGEGKHFLPAFMKSAVLAAVMTLAVYGFGEIACRKAVTLFFGLYGTFLLASAFSPQGHVPPQGNLFDRARWFFTPQGATPMHYNRPAYHIALVLLALSFITGAF